MRLVLSMHDKQQKARQDREKGHTCSETFSVLYNILLALGMLALNLSLKGKLYYRASNFKEIKVV